MDRRPNGGPVCQTAYPRGHYPEGLFIDDIALRHVASLAQGGAGKWHFAYVADKIYFADNPTGRKVEPSVAPRAVIWERVFIFRRRTALG